MDTRGTLKNTRKPFEFFSIVTLSAGHLKVSARNQNPHFCIYDFKSCWMPRWAFKKTKKKVRQLFNWEVLQKVKHPQSFSFQPGALSCHQFAGIVWLGLITANMGSCARYIWSAQTEEEKTLPFVLPTHKTQPQLQWNWTVSYNFIP